MKTRHHHMPALTRTFAGLDRCQQHRGELLTREGTCPRCDRERFQAHIAIAANAKEAARLQAITNVHSGKHQQTTQRRTSRAAMAREGEVTA